MSGNGNGSKGWFPEFDRIAVVFSDIEMGDGGEVDDFPHSAFLGRLLTSYLEGPYANAAIDFVFNGDTFDLLKTPYGGAYPHHITEDVALAKMSSVAAAHPSFFEAIRGILGHKSGNKRAHFVAGNHDMELLFPGVQRLIRSLCGDVEHVRFPGFELGLGPVHIEHGSQSDPLFRVDPEKPFIDHKGKRFLNISWASIALLDVIIPLPDFLRFFDQLKPRAQVMNMVPEAKELIMSLVWQYWTKDFWRDFLSLKDPLLKVHWTMVKEIVKRFTTNNPRVSIDKGWLMETVEGSSHELFLTGHLHQASSYYHGNKRIIQSGCFRDEFFILNEGMVFQPLLKQYYEIFIKDDRVVGVASRELQGPARPAEYFPASIQDLTPRIGELLDLLGDQSEDQADRKKQEAAEAKKGA